MDKSKQQFADTAILAYLCERAKLPISWFITPFRPWFEKAPDVLVIQGRGREVIEQLEKNLGVFQDEQSPTIH